MNLDIDVAGAEALARDLNDVPDELREEASKIVFRGALNIKRGLQADARSVGASRHFSGSIDYEMISDTEAEIGPNLHKKQGPLGILYTGTSTQAPVLSLNPPVDREEPRFELALIQAVEKLL